MEAEELLAKIDVRLEELRADSAKIKHDIDDINARFRSEIVQASASAHRIQTGIIDQAVMEIRKMILDFGEPG